MNEKDKFQAWAQQTMQAMAKHLASHGLVVKDEIKIEARWNYPFRILVAQAWGKRTAAEKFWLIAGDVPVDHAEASVAEDARAALKFFALRWQMQGARVKTADRDKAEAADSKLRVNWTEIGDSIAEKAEFIYALADDDRNWESTMRF